MSKYYVLVRVLGVPAVWHLFPAEPHCIFSLYQVVLKPAK